MKKLSEFIEEALCEASVKGDPKDMFKSAVMNPAEPVGGWRYDDIIDAIKNTFVKKEVRSRNITARKYSGVLASGEGAHVAKIGVGGDPMCICFGHLKSDKSHYGDYGRLYLLWDAAAAKDALESGNDVQFGFVRGSCNDSTWEEWNFTLDNTEEWKAKTKPKYQKTYLQMAYDNRNWDSSEYKAFNAMVKDLTGTDPKIDENTPNVYSFTAPAW